MQQQMVLPEGGLASFLTSNLDEMDDSRLAFGSQNGINSMRATAERMAKMGRGGDDVIIHATKNERLIPVEVSDDNPELMSQVDIAIANAGADPSAYIVGSETNSVNPYTGQREFFLKKLIGGVKNILKAVAPIVIPMALNFIAPGWGAVASGFIGGGITGLVQGKSFKESFKMGLMGGAIGGITQGFQNYKKTGDIFKAGEGLKGGFMSASRINPNTGDPYKTFDINQDVKNFFGAKPGSVEDLNPGTSYVGGGGGGGGQSTMDKFSDKAKDMFYNEPVTPSQARLKVLQTPGMTVDNPNFAGLVAQETVKGGIKLLPTTTALLGAGAAFGGFDPIPAEEQEDPYGKPSASEERLAANPERYKVGSAGDPTYITMADTLVNPYYEQYLRPQQAAEGGEMYPRRNGYIAGPGTETSDDIPAMLSDGEFVMTAQAVRGLGNGNRQQGVRKMYDMMRAFEGGAVA